MDKKSLKKPPIKECVIELYSSMPWKGYSEIEVESFFQNHLKEDFPINRPSTETQIEFNFKGDRSYHSQSLKKRYRFLSENNSKVVQLNQDMCVFNQLKPYPGSFELVLSQALSVFNNYMKCASSSLKPSVKSLFGIRYVNELKLLPYEKISDYICFAPNINSIKENNLDTSYFLQVKVPHDLYDIVLTLNHVTSSLEENIHVFDLYGKSKNEINFLDFEEEIKKMQLEVETLFFKSILKDNMFD